MNDMTRGAMVPMLDDEQLIDVLVNSLYPGAKRESAAMVLGYCRAAGLDPMLKPVHIVPMSVKTGAKDRYGNDEYVNRDVVMPGIGLYRVNAARTGQYAGQDEPVLGPMKVLEYTEVKRKWVNDGTKPDGSPKKKPVDTSTDSEIEYPEWVSVTVYRLVGGFRVAFTAREYWVENYATAGRDSDAPNAMWARRTIGQLVKCAEAQALRKGFPEVGSQPTAEELEGRTYEVDAEPAEPATAAAPARPMRASEAAASGNVATASTGNVATAALTDNTAEQQAAAAMVPSSVTAATAPAPEVAAPAAAPAPAPQQQAQAPTGEPASEGEKANVRVTAKAKNVDLKVLLAKLGYALDHETLAGMTKPMFKALKAAM
jgi:phage recombination protein Bet